MHRMAGENLFIRPDDGSPRDERTKTEFIQFLADNPDLRWWQSIMAFANVQVFVEVNGKQYDPFYYESDTLVPPWVPLTEEGIRKGQEVWARINGEKG